MSLVGFRAQNHPQQTPDATVDDRETAPEVFGPLLERFRFTLDVAAASHNAKLERYFTEDDDGLAQRWDGRIWCNPPYSNIRPWVDKAWREFRCARSGLPGPELIVMLLPANRTEQAWWQDLVEGPRLNQHWINHGFRVEFLRGRMRFIRPDAVIGPKGDRPPFGVCLVIWGAG